MKFRNLSCCPENLSMDKIAVKINVHTFSRKKQGNNETSLTQCILRLKGDKATKTECEKFSYSQIDICLSIYRINVFLEKDM